MKDSIKLFFVDDIYKAEYLRFEIFSWGENPYASRIVFLNNGDGIRLETFKSTFYGYVECWD